MGLFMPPTFAAAFELAEIWPLLAPLAAGAGAIYLLLPRPRPYPALWGTLLGGLALLLTGFFLLRTGAFSAETVLFYSFSAIALVSGTLLVTQHNPARAALSFTLVVLSTCGLFLLLAAPFLMAATIIIYAGAIVVTFLFVLMLATQEGLSDADARSREPLLATLTGFILLGALLYVLHQSYGIEEGSQQTKAIDEWLQKIRLARGKTTNDEIRQALGDDNVDDFIAGFKDMLRAGGSADLSDHITSHVQIVNGRIIIFQKADTEKVKEALASLEDVGERYRRRIGEQVGGLQPSNVQPEHYSNLSGPSPAVKLTELRRDSEGRSQLPAENSAYLGRSLFTDYLLPVELGGTLLLVATVGAIAIAHRRTNPERPS
jgi:NADH:ubiquinone oxidoreductase subunit 6 (subunit J)